MRDITICSKKLKRNNRNEEKRGKNERNRQKKRYISKKYKKGIDKPGKTRYNSKVK